MVLPKHNAPLAREYKHLLAQEKLLIKGTRHPFQSQVLPRYKLGEYWQANEVPHPFN